MTINLWKNGGQPLSYNPLPTGFINQVSTGIADYTIRFKAKSASSTTMRVQNAVEQIGVVVLTTEFKTYEYTFKSTKTQSLQLYDVSSRGDIIITDIELVQKPLPKLTINGIDGFKNGKWTANSGSTWEALDDSAAILNPVGQYHALSLSNNGYYLDCLPNTTYAVSASKVDGNGAFLGFAFYDASKVYISSSNGASNGLIHTFTTPINARYINPNFGTRATVGFTACTFKNVVFNLGSIPAPYSKKTGERMVVPVPKGNLFDGSLEDGMWNASTGLAVVDALNSRSVNFIPVKPSTNYYFSVPNGTVNWRRHFFDVNKNFISSTVGTENYITTPSNCYFVKFHSPKSNLNGSVIQLEPGTIPSPYSPYAVQVNKKPARYVAKKNLFDGKIESGGLDGTTGQPYVSSANRSANFIPVSGGKSVILSVLGKIITQPNSRIFQYDINKNHIRNDVDFKVTLQTQTAFVKFHSAGEISLSDLVQLEEGTTQTPYEPFSLILPRAKTGLAFNGVTDYLQLPSMTMDSIEIDCLIDSSMTGGVLLLDARTGLANGFIGDTVGNGWLSLSYGNVVLNSPSSAVPSLPKNQRLKLKATATNSFTDDVMIFAGYQGTNKLKGTLYKVTCYLAGQVVAQYDFENPANIVGDKVLSLADNQVPKKNLVPTNENDWEQGSFDAVNANLVTNNRIRLKNTVSSIAGRNYTISCASGYEILAFTGTDNANTLWGNPITFTAGSKGLRVVVRRIDQAVILPIEVIQAQPQIEEGSVSSTYEPYQLITIPRNVKNLIPSFEDARWSLHANAKALGKDYLRLESTGVTQTSVVMIPVLSGQQYYADCQTSGQYGINYWDKNNAPTGFTAWRSTPIIATMPTGTAYATFELRSLNNASTGVYTFIKPSLYQLDGKEGTIVGKPAQQNKTPKRSLYAKR